MQTPCSWEGESQRGFKCGLTDLGDDVLHESDLVLALLRAQAGHHDALARGDLLVARVDEVGKGPKRVGGRHARVAAAERDVDHRAGEDCVDDLRYAH